MAKPTIFRIIPFDASEGATVSFEWSGRAQASNKIEIRERDSEDSSDAVYSGVYTTYRSKHEIPGGVLENGKIYKARIRIETYVGDTSSSDSPSEWSDNIIFYCFTQPVLGFDGLKTKDELAEMSLVANEINSLGIYLRLTYTQEEGEELNSWTAFMYDTSYGIQQQTDLMYYASSTQTQFSGLSDKATYYVRATGTTVNGMEVDTGYIPIYTYYGLPSMFVNFDVVNNDVEGYISLKSAIVALLGTSGNGEDITYVGTDELRCADLTGNYVDFGTQPATNGSIEVNSNFTLYFKAKDIKVISKDYANEFKFPASGINEEAMTLGEILLYNAFLTLTDSNTGYRYSATLWKTEVGEELQYQVFLYCNEPTHEFGVWSNSFAAIGEGEYLYLIIQRSNATMSLKALVKENTLSNQSD